MKPGRRRNILTRLKSYHPAVPDTPPIDDPHISVSYPSDRVDQDRLDIQLSIDADTLAFLTYAEVEAYNPSIDERIAHYGNLIPADHDTTTPTEITLTLEERPLNYYYDVSLTPDLIDTTQLYVRPQDWTGVFNPTQSSEIAEIHSWYNHIYTDTPIQITTSTRFNRE